MDQFLTAHREVGQSLHELKNTSVNYHLNHWDFDGYFSVRWTGELTCEGLRLCEMPWKERQASMH